MIKPCCRLNPADSYFSIFIDPNDDTKVTDKVSRSQSYVGVNAVNKNLDGSWS